MIDIKELKKKSYKDVAEMVNNYRYWHSDKLDPTKREIHNNVIPHIFFLIQGNVKEQPKIYKLTV